MRKDNKIILFLIIIVFIQFHGLGQLSQEREIRDTIPAIDSASSTNVTPIHSGDTKLPELVFIENFVNNLETGGLIYNPPSEMTFNISESINATIVKGNTLGEPIKVAPYMEVNLRGSAFDIVPTTESRQFVAGDSPTIWKWEVIPRKIGNQTLDLLAYAIITMPDGHEEKRALIREKIIHIQVNPLEKPGMLDFIPSLFNGPWAKVIATLSGLLAFLALFFKDDILAWFRSRRKDDGKG